MAVSMLKFFKLWQVRQAALAMAPALLTTAIFAQSPEPGALDSDEGRPRQSETWVDGRPASELADDTHLSQEVETWAEDPSLIAPEEQEFGLTIEEDCCCREPPAESPLQYVGAWATWLPRTGDDGLGVTDLEGKAIIGMPFPTKESPLILTPGAGVHYFSGPDAPDLPPRVYDTYLEVRTLRKLSDEWTLDLGVTPGWYSDYEQSSSDGLRIGGRAIGIYTYSPTTKYVLGVLYLDREDIKLLPVGGVIWNPDPDTSYELVFPRPKLAKRLHVECNRETWAYIAGELGGGSWAIERADGSDDVFAYRDLRAILGIERKICKGPVARLEVGYVFAREIEYASSTPDFEPDDTVMLRAELGF